MQKKCTECKKEKDNLRDVNGRSLCNECVNNLTGEGVLINCGDCGDLIYANNTFFIELAEIRICLNCYDNEDYFRCSSCDNFFHLGDLEGDLCRHCLVTGDGDGNNAPRRDYNKKTDEFISTKTSGDIIKSLRVFGLELELLNDNADNLQTLAKDISTAFGFDHDGSIKGNNPIEIVTPRLGGYRGERVVKELLEKINKLKFTTNETCGLHVHLDGADFKDSSRITKKLSEFKLKDVSGYIGMSIYEAFMIDYFVARTKYSPNKIIEIIINRDQVNMLGDVEFGVIPKESIDIPLKTNENLVMGYKEIEIEGKKFSKNHFFILNREELGIAKKERKERVAKYESIIKPFSFDSSRKLDYDKLNKELLKEFKTTDATIINALAKKVSKNDYLSIAVRDHGLARLKTLLYLFTTYNNVFLAMIPQNRRQGNKYCQHLSMAFSAVDIENIQRYGDLEKMWYKSQSLMDIERKKGNKYERSRYYGMNLHSLFSKLGTIEIRFHPGTVHEDKILFWVAFHQQILDKISSGELSIPKLRAGADIYDVDEKVDYFLSILKLDTKVEKYVFARIKFFNKENNDK